MPHTFQLAERGETIKTIKIKGKFLSETMILPTNQHPIRWASQRAWRVRRRAFEDKHCPATRTLADLCKNKTLEHSNQKNEYSIGERFAVTMMPKWWEPRAFGLPNCSVLIFFFFWNFSLSDAFWQTILNACKRRRRRAREQQGERTDGGTRKSLQTFQKLKFNYRKRKQPA